MCPQRLISCWAEFQNSETSWDSSDLGKTFNDQVVVTTVFFQLWSFEGFSLGSVLTTTSHQRETKG